MKKLLTIICALALCVVCAFSIVGCSGKLNNTTQNNGNQPGDNFYQRPFQISVFSSTPEVYSVEDGTYLQYSLNAVVYPETALNKKVSWSVSWVDATSETPDINEYVTINELTDTTADLLITKFDEAVLGMTAEVTCTTAVGGYTDSCLVHFQGMATSIDLLKNNVSVEDTIDVYLTQEYELSVALDNIFNLVNANANEVEVSFDMVGQFTVNVDYINNGSVKGSEQLTIGSEEAYNDFTIYWDSNAELSNNAEALSKTYSVSDFISGGGDNNVVGFTALKDLSGVVENQMPRTGYKVTLVDGEDFNIRLHVAVKNTDVKKTVLLNLVKDVTGVQITNPDITI